MSQSCRTIDPRHPLQFRAGVVAPSARGVRLPASKAMSIPRRRGGGYTDGNYRSNAQRLVLYRLLPECQAAARQVGGRAEWPGRRTRRFGPSSFQLDRQAAAFGAAGDGWMPNSRPSHPSSVLAPRRPCLLRDTRRGGHAVDQK